MNRTKLRLSAACAGLLLLAACSGGGSEAPQLSPALRHDLAAAATQDSGADPSLGLLRTAATQAPDDAAAQERYALAAEQGHQYAEALAAIDRAVALGGAAPMRLATQGRIALKAGDVPAATYAYTRATRADPNNPDTLNGLGVAQDLARDHAAAQRSYRAALALSPNDWDVLGNLALSLLMSDRAADAVSAVAPAGTDAAAPRRARHDLALALVAAGERARALHILQSDMSPAQASALADEFAKFARWLASPEGTMPRTL